ncbi:hypothetical protein [Methylobacterium planeticum]|uniref:Uncharacterized protein n=1 Tax=Methylobacterium planeticum TaxID=2615211 RepID=A0A6N6MQQ2_9HYPH|nr:hypothetical protein [Methylobacterium planeticum]KAB1073984.1 hypothetical protein F6X51_09685 [Methylobacterium planeticum]
MDAKLLSPEFPHTVVVPCFDDGLADVMSHAWRLGACGVDWTWGRVGADRLRFSFKRDTDGAAFRQSAAPISAHALGSPALA